MRWISVVLIFSLFMSSAAAAPVKKLDYGQGKIVFQSVISKPYNENFSIYMVLSREFEMKYPRTSDNDFQINIEFKPTDKTRTEIVQPLNGEFLYKIIGDNDMQRASFAIATSSYNSAFGTGKFSVYGDNSEGYSVQEHYKRYSVGPSFMINYSPGMAFKNMPKDSSVVFGERLMNAAKNRKEILIRIPYAEDKSNVKEVKFLDVSLDAETLADWNEIFSVDPVSERKALQF